METKLLDKGTQLFYELCKNNHEKESSYKQQGPFSAVLSSLCLQAQKEGTAKTRYADDTQKEKCVLYKQLSEEDILYPYASALKNIVDVNNLNNSNTDKNNPNRYANLHEVMNSESAFINNSNFDSSQISECDYSYSRKLQNICLLEKFKLLMSENQTNHDSNKASLDRYQTVSEILNSMKDIKIPKNNMASSLDSNELCYSKLLLNACFLYNCQSKSNANSKDSVMLNCKRNGLMNAFDQESLTFKDNQCDYESSSNNISSMCKTSVNDNSTVKPKLLLKLLNSDPSQNDVNIRCSKPSEKNGCSSKRHTDTNHFTHSSKSQCEFTQTNSCESSTITNNNKRSSIPNLIPCLDIKELVSKKNSTPVESFSKRTSSHLPFNEIPVLDVHAIAYKNFPVISQTSCGSSELKSDNLEIGSDARHVCSNCSLQFQSIVELHYHHTLFHDGLDDEKRRD